MTVDKARIMTWAEAMKIASFNVALAADAANIVDGEESAKVYARVADTAISFAAEVRKATDGKNMREVEEMMQG